MKLASLLMIFLMITSSQAAMIDQVKTSYESRAKNGRSESEKKHYQAILDKCFTANYKKVPIKEVKKCARDQSQKFCDIPSQSASGFCTKIKTSRNRKRPTRAKRKSSL